MNSMFWHNGRRHHHPPYTIWCSFLLHVHLIHKNVWVFKLVMSILLWIVKLQTWSEIFQIISKFNNIKIYQLIVLESDIQCYIKLLNETIWFLKLSFKWLRLVLVSFPTMKRSIPFYSKWHVKINMVKFYPNDV
jgi:hypothetical protein